MMQETVNRVEVMDVLNTLRRQVVKATCLLWDMSTDFFEPFTAAADKGDFMKVRMMATAEAEQAGIKAEIISDLLIQMSDMIDEYKGKYTAGSESNGTGGSELQADI